MKRSGVAYSCSYALLISPTGSPQTQIAFKSQVSDQIPLLARSPPLPSSLLSQKWLARFAHGTASAKVTALRFLRVLGKAAITDINDYKQMYDFFQHNFGTGDSARDAIFLHSDIATDPFLGVNDRWNDDDVFAQAAISGINPVQIERVTGNESVGADWQELQASLNPAVSWDEAVQYVLPNSSVAQVGSAGNIYTTVVTIGVRRRVACHNILPDHS